ncbi:MAG: hypothetical protein J0H06_16055 [Actinobacteria bacterium]|nr:hypothetical protein [Actinomycetota bacterium]
MLALLALLVVPVFADAGEVPTYETESTESFTVPTKKPKPKHQTSEHEESNNAPAEGSKAEKQPESETGSEGHKESEGHKATNSTGKSDGTGGGGEGQSKPDKGTTTKTESGKVGEQQDLGGNSTGTPAASKSSSSGGSSPLVPILIVLVVLAAISIGVVLYRQRKSSGPGQDGRVSSPNAS